MTKLIPIFVLGVLLWGCSNNTQDDLEPIIPEVEAEEQVTYSDVKFIFDNSCVVCHSNPPQNGAPMSLDSYLAARDAVLNRGLLDRVSREEGADGLMPLGGPRLPQQTIDLLIQWSEDGLLEN
ncbi:hypothetical protein [Gilvibacter sp. SZ-19]|jgi:cytochrome c5|uniref:hypothetical protein n=1 Tax=unclassified Gilvibacter TaxID=2625242 RepID=UPI000B3C194B|nr:hypothetical protein [Gilvibacter sp. SZ-19]ARV10944.1 hypothetical protein BTO09_00685 [Gilvibacter sp. SZ-19]